MRAFLIVAALATALAVPQMRLRAEDRAVSRADAGSVSVEVYVHGFTKGRCTSCVNHPDLPGNWIKVNAEDSLKPEELFTKILKELRPFKDNNRAEIVGPLATVVESGTPDSTCSILFDFRTKEAMRKDTSTAEWKKHAAAVMTLGRDTSISQQRLVACGGKTAGTCAESYPSFFTVRISCL